MSAEPKRNKLAKGQARHSLRAAPCSEIDANVQSVRRKMLIRAERGLDKYGVTTERDDLDTLQWLQHAQEEAMDLTVYLERLMSDIRRRMDFS